MTNRDETSRIAQRCAIRKDIARARLIAEQVEAINSEISRLDLAVIEAADKHAAATGPLQRELAALESAVTERIVRREEPDAEAAERRKEVRRLIELENSRLSQVKREQDILKRPLIDRREEVAKERGGLRTEPDLLRKNVANPALWLKFFATNKKIQLLSSACDAASEIQSRTDSTGGTYDSGNSEEWSAYGSMLGAELAAARQESRRLEREIINE